MKTVNEKLRAGIKLTADLAILNAAYWGAYLLIFHSPFFEKVAVSLAGYRVLLTVANLLFIVVFMLSVRTASSPKRLLLGVGMSEIVVRYSLFIASYLGAIVFSQGYEFSRTFHLSFLLILMTFGILGNLTLVPLIEKFLLPVSAKSRVLIVEGTESCDPLIGRLEGLTAGYELMGVLSDGEPKYHRLNGHCRGSIDQLEEIIGRIGVDEVIIMSPFERSDHLARIIEVGKANHVLTRIVPSHYDALLDWDFEVEPWLGLPVATISSHKLAQERNQVLKRIIDIVLASFIVVTAFPLIFLVVAPAIWLTSKGPILFKQLRKGYRGGAFFCYKFRTMRIMEKSDEAIQASSDDPRKTTIGYYLRRTNLDEIPQLFNVLRGEMSLVGPRPHMVEHDELYSGFIKQYKVRLIAKPGLTGWAQVNGYRGTTEDPALMLKRVEHDIWYIKNWSLLLDIKIIARTIIRMLEGDPNAY
jgi:putative colanic acid biosynthesis UDP-glucose lipid carrier transferase